MSTAYVIRTPDATPQYYALAGRWVATPDRAVHFEFQTIAELYAQMIQEWPLEHYVVEPIFVPMSDGEALALHRLLKSAL